MDGRGEVAAEPVSERVAYKQEFADVRDVVQGLVLALEKDAAVGEEFTLGGRPFFDGTSMCPGLRRGMGWSSWMRGCRSRISSSSI